MTIDAMRLLIAVALVLTNAYELALWCYVLVRDGISFSWIFAASNVAALFVSVINVIFVFNVLELHHFLWPAAFDVVYALYIVVHHVILVLNVIVPTCLVR